jgi:hypothetical protein
MAFAVSAFSWSTCSSLHCLLHAAWLPMHCLAAQAAKWVEQQGPGEPSRADAAGELLAAVLQQMQVVAGAINARDEHKSEDPIDVAAHLPGPESKHYIAAAHKLLMKAAAKEGMDLAPAKKQVTCPAELAH